MPKSLSADSVDHRLGRSIPDLLCRLRDELRGYPEVEAEILIEESLRAHQGFAGTRSELFGWSESLIRVGSAAETAALMWADQRKKGAPLQHLTGWQVFLEHRYRVSSSVLIPRPETEGLVMLVRDWIRMQSSQGRQINRGFEFGLGSGVISLELLCEFPSLKMVASEVSSDAIEVASSNAARLLGERESPDRLRIVRDLATEGLAPEAVDFLVSNPPYLDPARAEEETTLEVRLHEPEIALFGPADDPSFFYRQLALSGRSWLKGGAPCFLEIPHERAVEVMQIFEAAGWKEVSLQPDLTGRSRYLVGHS